MINESGQFKHFKQLDNCIKREKANNNLARRLVYLGQAGNLIIAPLASTNQVYEGIEQAA